MSIAPASPLVPTAQHAGESREIVRRELSGGIFTNLTIHKPAEKSKSSSTILLLPGWSGPRCGPADFLVQLARELAACGHTAVRMDLMGRGDASGSFEACDLDTMIGNAAEILEFLSKSPEYSAPFVVGGICSGANVALGLASLKRQLVTSALAYSVLPYQPARSEAFERRRRWKNLKQYASKALKPGTWAKLLRGEIQMKKVKENLTSSEKTGTPSSPGTTGAACVTGKADRNLKDSARDIEKELLAWKGNALMVWGSADEEAALSEQHFRGLHEKGMASAAEFYTVAQANHNFYSRAWRDEVERVTLQFLMGGK